ncbi:MAG: MFS transporter, partial [Candidatus Bathyarchaeota archaeon]|nr:MFS transporter [Candidatus Bathyarchaeota archaeon]
MSRASWLRWSYSYTVLLLCWFGWICIYLTKSALPPLLPVLSNEIGLSHAQTGLIESAYLVGYILVKVPLGYLANKFGMKRILIIGMIGYGTASALFTFASTYPMVLLLRFLVGFFQGIHLPVANALLSERFGPKQGRAIGFHESGPNVGATIAYPIAITIASVWNWRWTFLLLSIPAFLLAVAVFSLLKDEPFGGQMQSSTAQENNQRIRDYVWVLLPMTLTISLYNICVTALMTFTPSYLVEFRGLSLASAGLISMILPAAGFVAKVGSGFAAERVGSKNAICGAAALTGVSIVLLTLLEGDLPLALNFVLMGLVLYAFSPIVYSSVTSALPSRLKAAGLSAVTIVGNLVGAFSAAMVGSLIDA